MMRIPFEIEESNLIIIISEDEGNSGSLLGMLRIFLGWNFFTWHLMVISKFIGSFIFLTWVEDLGGAGRFFLVNFINFSWNFKSFLDIRSSLISFYPIRLNFLRILEFAITFCHLPSKKKVSLKKKNEFRNIKRKLIWRHSNSIFTNF